MEVAGLAVENLYWALVGQPSILRLLSTEHLFSFNTIVLALGIVLKESLLYFRPFGYYLKRP